MFNTEESTVNGDKIPTTEEFIDSAKAEQYLKSNTRNRPPKKDHIKHLSKLMVENDNSNPGTKKFKDFHSTIKFDRNGKLLDGQHRLKGLVEANKTNPGIGFWFKVERGHDPSIVDTLDCVQKTRSLVDALSYHVEKIGKLERKQCADVDKLFGGIGSLKLSQRPTMDEKVQFLLNNKDVINEVIKAFQPASKATNQNYNHAHYRSAILSFIIEDPQNKDTYIEYAERLVGKKTGFSNKDPLMAFTTKIFELEKKHAQVNSNIHSHTRMAFLLQAIDDQFKGIDASKKSYQLSEMKYHKFSKTKFSISEKEV
jgi:hypothetical protein